MKKIKIFLGSSIIEFEKERNELELFIRNLSDRFEDDYNIKIVPLRCEYMDNHIRVYGTQNAINEELVCESDMCFFIFFTKVGEFTEEEFRVALDKFKKDGKPKIYIYFKNISSDVKIDDSVREFMLKIDEELKHYHGTFDHIDTIKLRILLNLKIQEMDFISVETRIGKIYVDGKKTVDLKNISEFANNDVLKQLNDELFEIETEYYQMRHIYQAGDYSEKFHQKYSQIAAKRQDLIESIGELEKQIFKISLRLCKDDVYGEISPRQKEAYRLFELGDYSACMNVLDYNDISSDFERKIHFLDEQKELIVKQCIDEHKLAISILRASKMNEKAVDDIICRFNAISQLVETYNICKTELIEYASFLRAHGLIEQAYSTIQLCERISIQGEDHISAMYYEHSLICKLIPGKREEAESFIKKAIKHYKETDAKFTLASYYNSLGYYYEVFDANRSEDYEWKVHDAYKNSFTILKSFRDELKTDSEKIDYVSIDLGIIGFILSNYFLFGKDLKDKALDTVYQRYSDALSIMNSIYEKNEESQYCLHRIFTGFANYYSEIKNYQKSIEYAKKSLKIIDALYESNPYKYTSSIVQSMLVLSELYSNTKNYSDAKRIALDAIRILELNMHNLDLNLSDIYAYDLLWLGSILFESIREENALTPKLYDCEEKMKMALKEYLKLFKIAPQEYATYICIIYTHLCVINKKKKNYIMYWYYRKKMGKMFSIMKNAKIKNKKK